MLIPVCGDFVNESTTKEEFKIENETRKILSINCNIMSIAVRIPVSVGHSEAVFIKIHEEISQRELIEIYMGYENLIGTGLEVGSSCFPMPINVRNSDRTLVGRLKVLNGKGNIVALFNCANNLRVGAATNAIRIARYLINSSISALKNRMH